MKFPASVVPCVSFPIRALLQYSAIWRTTIHLAGRERVYDGMRLGWDAGGVMRSAEVKSAVLAVGRPLPVYPDEQTSSESVGMSQTCQKRSFQSPRMQLG